MGAHLWFFLTLGASLCWGINYTMSEKLLHSHVSLFFMMLLSSFTFLTIALVMGGLNGGFKNSLQVFQSGQVSLFVPVLYVLSVIVGWFFVNTAITLKNSSAVSMLEITYPFFTILFTWLFFNTVHVNAMTFVGFLMTLGGVILIYLKG